MAKRNRKRKQGQGNNEMKQKNMQKYFKSFERSLFLN